MLYLASSRLSLPLVLAEPPGNFNSSLIQHSFVYQIIDISNYFTIPFDFNISGFDCTKLFCTIKESVSS
uniref:Putative secreted protein n=1 Tax=Ixodes ricinus TaxID=34613 RepID=A0A6B0U0S0_IXORI